MMFSARRPISRGVFRLEEQPTRRASVLPGHELEAAFDVVTHAGARALRLDNYGIGVGASADFVTLGRSMGPRRW